MSSVPQKSATCLSLNSRCSEFRRMWLSLHQELCTSEVRHVSVFELALCVLGVCDPVCIRNSVPQRSTMCVGELALCVLGVCNSVCTRSYVPQKSTTSVGDLALCVLGVCGSVCTCSSVHQKSATCVGELALCDEVVMLVVG